MVGTVDEIAPPPGVRAIRQAAPRADVYELALRAGHFGLVVGSTSNPITWPTVAAWARWRDGEGELPEGVGEVPDDPAADLVAQRDRIQNRVGYGLELAGAVGAGIARSMVGGVAPHDAQRARARPRGRRLAAAARAPGADPAEHADLARAAGRGAHAARRRRHHVPLRGPRLQRPRGQPADRQRRARADLDRRAPGRARRRADGLAPERAGGGHRAQPARRRRGAAAPRRRHRARGIAGRGAADHRRPRARRAGGRAGHGAHLRARRRRRPARPRAAAHDRHGADRPADGDAAGLVSPQPGPGLGPGVHPLHRRGRLRAHEPDHQPALGHLGVRHRVIGGALARRHRLQRHPALSPVGADDEHRRGDRRAAPGWPWPPTSIRPRSGTRSAATA